MKYRILVVNGLLFSFLAGIAAPSAMAGEVKDREENQQDRIAQGIRSGELTKGEAARLEKGEAKIEKDRQKALSDGKLTPKEKKKLNREENKESKKIYKAKHNGKVRKTDQPAEQPTQQ
jgi:Tfp pilus assembly protein FimT